MRIPGKAKRRDSDTNLISLINIVFLILVFFMIMGRITPADVLPIDLPASTSASAMEAEGIVVLVDPSGRIAVNSERVDRSALATTLSKLIEPTGALTAQDIVLKADADTRFGQLDEILEIIRNTGVNRLSLVTDTSR